MNTNDRVINKLELLGYDLIKPIYTVDDDECYLFTQSSLKMNHVLYIPDDVVLLNGAHYGDETKLGRFTHKLIGALGNIKVIGGKSVISTDYLFCGCNFKQIDLSDFDTRKVEEMSHMFDNCKAHKIDMSGKFSTDNVQVMNSMFQNCNVPELDLSNFNTSKVYEMTHMFEGCKAEKINLESFDTSNVIGMSCMFCNCDVKELDLSHFKTNALSTMWHMFFFTKLLKIDLSNFPLEVMVDEEIFNNAHYIDIKYPSM